MDSEGGRLKGTRFSVGSGSPYAYGVLDDGSAFSSLSFTLSILIMVTYVVILTSNICPLCCIKSLV